MRRIVAVTALFLTVAGLPALSADGGTDGNHALTGAEFEAIVTGRTMYYSSGDQPYGVEQYKPDRHVTWAFVGDDCRNGEWYEDSGYICFVYEDEPDPQCWTFYNGPDGLMAHFRDNPAGAPLVAVQQSPEPMACLGPDIGV
jgi:hypothetical protein